MKYILLIICCLMMLSGCTSDPVVNNNQNIDFSTYTMSIPADYISKNKEDVIDHRVLQKVIALYQKPSSSLEFSDNIIISQDTLTPRASLEDYAQAAIGGISYTRGQYHSLSFSKGTLMCDTITIPTITNTFSIYRTASTSNIAETLYFIQYFVHKNDEIIIVSLSTNQEDSLSSLRTMIESLSCTSIEK